MNNTDLRGTLMTRRTNLAALHKKQVDTVTLLEAELVRARRAADTTSGAVQAIDQALQDLAPATTPPHHGGAPADEPRERRGGPISAEQAANAIV